MGQFDLITDDVAQPPSWNQSIDQYLEDHEISCEKAVPLMGGMSAYVWKLEGFTKDPCSTVPSQRQPMKEPCVMKYGDSTFKGLPTLEASSDRMGHEARALTSEVVAQACRKEPAIKVAQVLQSTDEAIVMNWAGEIELRKAFIKDKSLDVKYLGSRIGKWAGHMHVAGVNNPEVSSWTNETTVGVMAAEQDNFRKCLLEEGYFDQSAVDKVVDILRRPASVQTLVAYDFRPMNVLLKSSDDPIRPIPTIIDWEVSTYLDPAYDLRIWAAEAIVLEAHHGSERGLLASFLRAYREHAGPAIVTKEFVCKTALLVASVWLMLMPCAIWDVSTEEECKKWRGAAFEYARAAINQDMEWLSRSPLSPLLDQTQAGGVLKL